MSKMAKKISFDLDRAINRITKPSVFDRLVREIDAVEIPPKYIQTVLVQYYDGNVIELEGSDLSNPIPVSKDANWNLMEDVFKNMKDIKIFINTERLETDVNQRVEDYLGRFC